KFLMAGKSGLNLTHDAAGDAVLAPYAEAAPWLAPALARHGPEDIQAWAEALGQPLFTGSSGRVFPRAMKASPLLRAWLARLAAQGAELRPRWRWTGWTPAGAFAFDTPDGPRVLAPQVAVLALGGASWRRLGADGAWTDALTEAGAAPASFQPANMGLAVDWSRHMAPHFGQAIKPAVLRAGALAVRAEFTLSARGLEGGGIYAVARAVREGAALTVDLAPGLAPQAAAERLAGTRAKDAIGARLRKALGLSAPKRALLQEFAHPLPREPAALAARVKALPIRHAGPRPMDEAISTAGGVRARDLSETYELRARRNLWCAGEMLDWEAPTGGWLLTACLATGRLAGEAAAARLDALATAPPAPQPSPQTDLGRIT
ncbi:MAG: TIGR03862 family flavoprotein, partial [Pseudomonadota bacterium]